MYSKLYFLQEICNFSGQVHDYWPVLYSRKINYSSSVIFTVLEYTIAIEYKIDHTIAAVATLAAESGC